MNIHNSNRGTSGHTWRLTVAVPVELAFYHWNPNDCGGKQFSTKPTLPIRFRCVGAPSASPTRLIRVELARALDPMPVVDRIQITEFCGALALAIGETLGLEISPIPPDLIDFSTNDER